MVVITITKVKELLGISVTTFDAAITAKIPYIDAKVKQITNNKWDFKFVGSPVLNTNKMYVHSYLPNDFAGGYYSGVNNTKIKDSIYSKLEIGQIISGTGIPADTYITNITQQGYTENNAGGTDDYVYIEMSANATSTVASTEITAGINIAYQDIIAKGVQYLINSTSTSIPGASVASKSFGPVSVSYSAKAQKIDGNSGMPAWFIQGLPIYTTGG